jgi:phosphate:Na+ symporter
MADELESIADALQSLSIYRSRLYKRSEDISPAAWQDTLEFFDEVTGYFDRIMAARKRNAEVTEVKLLIKEGRQVRKSAKEKRQRHLDRLRAGDCQAMTAQTFSDMFMSLQHIKNHTVNYVEAYAGI